MELRKNKLFISTIVAAGGTGSRLGIAGGKQLLSLAGKPILIHTLEKLIPFSSEMIIVIEASKIERLQEMIDKYGLKNNIKKIVAGGDTRAISVHNAFTETSPEAELIMIHDGVRPFIEPKNIEQTINAAEQFGAAVLCTKVKDTIKKEAQGFIAETPQRELLWAAQTPQVIKKQWMEEAYQQLPNWQTCTDDVSLVEMLQKKVKIVEGSYTNIKITTAEDLLIAESFLKKRSI